MRAQAKKPADTLPLFLSNDEQQRIEAGARQIMRDCEQAPDGRALFAVVDRTLRQRQWLARNREDLHAQVHAALMAAHRKFGHLNTKGELP